MREGKMREGLGGRWGGSGRAARRGGVLAAGLCLGFLSAVSCPAPGPETPERPRGLRVEYASKGVLPGSRPEEGNRSALQRLTVDASGTRLLYEEFLEVPPAAAAPGAGPELRPARKFILRMDKSPPVIYEILDGGRSYREHQGDLNELQSDRRIAEENLRKLSKQLSKAEREEFLKRNHIRPDGTREVDVKVNQGKKVLDLASENLVVTENGRTILDAQVTRQMPGAKSYYQLYRRLGAFSEEVLEKLARMEGLPLAGRITVVTALPVAKFDFEAKNAQPVDVPETIFELPSGATKVPETPLEAACHLCGKKVVDVEDAPAKGLLEGRIIYFCTNECFEKWDEATRKKGGAGN